MAELVTAIVEGIVYALLAAFKLLALAIELCGMLISVVVGRLSGSIRERQGLGSAPAAEPHQDGDSTS